MIPIAASRFAALFLLVLSTALQAVAMNRASKNDVFGIIPNQHANSPLRKSNSAPGSTMGLWVLPDHNDDSDDEMSGPSDIDPRTPHSNRRVLAGKHGRPRKTRPSEHGAFMAWQPRKNTFNTITSGAPLIVKDNIVASKGAFVFSKQDGMRDPQLQVTHLDAQFHDCEPLASGSYGDVMSCTNSIDGIKYAIKKLPQRNTFEQHRALREVHILAHISQYLDTTYLQQYRTSWTEANHAYIQMMLYPATLSARGLLDDHSYVLEDILKGLNTLHMAGITHGDVKPDNIGVCTAGVCKASQRRVRYVLLDFGQASLRDSSMESPGSGSGAYLHSEILATHPQDLNWERRTWSDLYSLAVSIVFVAAKQSIIQDQRIDAEAIHDFDNDHYVRLINADLKMGKISDEIKMDEHVRAVVMAIAGDKNYTAAEALNLLYHEESK